MALIEALPKKVVEEQVVLYRKRDEAMVATQVQPPPKIQLGACCRYNVRMQVAARFHDHLKEEGIGVGERLPWGAMLKFTKKHILWTTK